MTRSGENGERDLAVSPRRARDRHDALGPTCQLEETWSCPAGMIGRMRREGYSRLCLTVCFAEMKFTSDAILFPVFGLRSKRGKLLLEISSLMRCPVKNTMLVGRESPGYGTDGH
jgi:hypothetical protein